MNRLKIAFPYLLLVSLLAVVGITNLPAWNETQPDARNSSPAAMDERIVDVVCHMEVNTAWDIHSEYGGRTYYFCGDRCRRMFERDPGHYLALKCVVCRTPLGDRPIFTATYLDKTYELCSAEHRALFKEDPAAYFMHSMWGIPAWLYYASIALVLIVSFGVFDWLSRRGGETIANSEWRIAKNRWPSQQVSLGGPIHANMGVRHAIGNSHRPEASASTVQQKEKEDRRDADAPHVLDRSTIQECEQTPICHASGQVVIGAAGALALPIISAATVLNPRRGRGRWTARRTPVDAQSTAIHSDRFDVLSISWMGAALRSRIFRFGLQAFFVVAFLLIIAAGLFGNQNPALNIAPILTWTIWWALLIVLILFAGKAWCYVCPWDALAGWAEKLSFGQDGLFGFLKLWKKSDDGLSLGYRWPRIIRNISLATILFVGLTWIELGFGVTMKPRITAYLAVAMLLMAVVSALLFDRKSFCRYGCLVGRVSGLYALFAGTEVRPREHGVCEKCRTKECVKGSETAYGCPTFLYPGKLETNTYCIQCMECIQACPHDNLAVNLRPWGSDLAVAGKPRTDEAYLALLMLSITGFHGLTMTPVWNQFIGAIRASADVGRMLGFSLGMAVLMLTPIAIYAGLVAVSKWVGDGHSCSEPLRYRDYFIRYAYALLPIALFYHIAHNLEHLLMEGPKVLAMVSDPFGWNWNLFGTAGWTIPPMISLGTLWLIQVLLVLIGHVYSLWVAQKTSLRLFGTARGAFRSQLPMLVGMICFSVFSLWLLKQPMEMRTSAM
ncbi:MAG: YHS domain-containing protein [Phycisphaerae bacterium]